MKDARDISKNQVLALAKQRTARQQDRDSPGCQGGLLDPSISQKDNSDSLEVVAVRERRLEALPAPAATLFVSGSVSRLACLRFFFLDD